MPPPANQAAFTRSSAMSMSSWRRPTGACRTPSGSGARPRCTARRRSRHGAGTRSRHRRTRGEGLAIHPHRPVLQRPDDVVRRILQGEQIAALLEVGQISDRDERLDRAVAGTGAVTRQRRVDSERPVLHGDDRVGHRQRKAVCRCAHARRTSGGWRLEPGAVRHRARAGGDLPQWRRRTTLRRLRGVGTAEPPVRRMRVP